MKSHLTKVSLALLSAVFLLGCQEQGSEPVGPEGLGPEFNKPPHDHDKDDGGGTKEATLDLGDGMQFMGLAVTVNQDSNKKLNVGNDDFVEVIPMNFTERGECVGIKATNGSEFPTEDEFGALVAELTVSKKRNFLTMQIDKRGLTAGEDATTSEDHFLHVAFEGTLGPTRIQLGTGFDKQIPPNTVKWTQPDEGQDAFEFTGPVVVWAHGGGVKDHRIIWCAGVEPEPNKVVATLNR